MPTDPRDSLPNDIEALLASERSVPGPQDGVEARVLSRVEATLALGPGGGSGGEPGRSPSGTSRSGVGPSSSGSHALSRFLATRAAISTATFVLGTATGIGIHVAWVGAGLPRPETPLSVPAAPAPTPPAPVPPTPIPEKVQEPESPPAISASPQPDTKRTPRERLRAAEPLERSEPRTSAPTVATPPSPQAPAPIAVRGTDRSAIERSLLEQARTALARGNAAGALEAVARHEKDFADGSLIEEREALAVQALVLAREYDEAKRRADRFEARFPHSILLPAVRAALENMP